MTTTASLADEDRALKERTAQCGRWATTRRWRTTSSPGSAQCSSLPARSRPGQRVLDVAAGSGNAAIPAARAGADVVASDLTPELLGAGKEF